MVVFVVDSNLVLKQLNLVALLASYHCSMAPKHVDKPTQLLVIQLNGILETIVHFVKCY